MFESNRFVQLDRRLQHAVGLEEQQAPSGARLECADAGIHQAPPDAKALAVCGDCHLRQFVDAVAVVDQCAGADDRAFAPRDEDCAALANDRAGIRQHLLVDRTDRDDDSTGPRIARELREGLVRPQE